MRGEYSTKQRELILSLLRENNAHVRASDIARYLSQQGQSVSVATVYRTLDRLVKDGIVKKMMIGQGAGACYQYIGGAECNEHFHLKCIQCGRLIHLSCEFLHSVENHILKDHGFTVSSGRTIIYGTCKNCSCLQGTTDIDCSLHKDCK